MTNVAGFDRDTLDSVSSLHDLVKISSDLTRSLLDLAKSHSILDSCFLVFFWWFFVSLEIVHHPTETQIVKPNTLMGRLLDS